MFSETPLVRTTLLDKNRRVIPFVSSKIYFNNLHLTHEVFIELDVDWERFKEFCEEYERAPSLEGAIRQWRSGNEIQN